MIKQPQSFKLLLERHVLIEEEGESLYRLLKITFYWDSIRVELVSHWHLFSVTVLWRKYLMEEKSSHHSLKYFFLSTV